MTYYIDMLTYVSGSYAQYAESISQVMHYSILNITNS